MMRSEHFRKLESLYLSAEINSFYQPGIIVTEKAAEIIITVEPKYFHSGQYVHGSIYFKLLDDACYFACQSMETRYFLVTSAFNIQFIAPVAAGTLTARSTVTAATRNVSLAHGEIFDDRNRLVATGNGSFMKSRLALNEEVGYR